MTAELGAPGTEGQPWVSHPQVQGGTPILQSRTLAQWMQKSWVCLALRWLGGGIGLQ